MMKSVLLGLAIVSSTSMFGAAQLRAEERPAIVVPLPIPEVGVEGRDRRDRTEDRRRIETDGRGDRGGCESKSVTRDGPEGSKTVTKERCN
jgi:hypothetical protein